MARKIGPIQDDEKLDGDGHAEDKGTNNVYQKYANYCAILCAILLYKGGEVMYSQVSEQYIYHKFKQTLPIELPGGQNETTSFDCPGNASGKTGNEISAKQHTSQLEMFMSITTFGIALFTMTFLGILSDFVGRKLIMVLSVLGYALQTLLATLIVYFDWDPLYFILAHSFDGIFGTQYTFALAWCGMIADVTPVGNKRSFYIALFEISYGIGRLATHFSTGYFIEFQGFLFPTLTSSAMCFFAIAIFVVALPETNKGAKSKIFSCADISRTFTKFYTDRSTFPERKLFWLNQGSTFLILLPIMGEGTLTVLQELGTPFCWSPTQIGWYGSLNQFMTYVVGLLFLRPLQIILSDGHIAMLGACSQIAFYVVFGLAYNDVMMYISIVVGMVKSLPYSILRGMASNMVSSEKQGTLFASLSATQILCRLISSSIFNNIYTQTVMFMRGLVFYTMAVVTLIGLVLLIILNSAVKKIQLRNSKTNIVNNVERTIDK